MTMPPPIPRRLLGPNAQQADLEQTAMLTAAMAGKKAASDILKPQRQIGQPPPMPMAAMGGIPQMPGAPPPLPSMPPVGGMSMPPVPASGVGEMSASTIFPPPALPNAPAPGGMGAPPAPIGMASGAVSMPMPPGPAMPPPPMMARGGVVAPARGGGNFVPGNNFPMGEMPQDRNPPGIQLLDGVLSAPELFQRFLQFRQGGGDAGVLAGGGGGLDSGMDVGDTPGESPPILGPEDVDADGYFAGDAANLPGMDVPAAASGVPDGMGAGLALPDEADMGDDTDLDDARAGSPPPPVFARWLKEAAPNSDSPLARAMGQAFAQSPDELTAIWNALRDVAEEEGAEDELPEPVLRMLGKQVAV